jgi:hypothetical protein
MVAGLLLLAGAAITLSLHAAGAPEALLDFLYDKLLSGLDVPPNPSPAANDFVGAGGRCGAGRRLCGAVARR